MTTDHNAPDRAALIAALISFLPPAVARAVLAEGRAPDTPRAERFPAAVLFADVSGFTALSEQFARSGAAGGARDGAEELTFILNRYFSSMIGILEAEGGEVVQFSGDALLAVFPAAGDRALLREQVLHARQAARDMQRSMAEFAGITTSVGTIELGMKIGVGAGDVLALTVGGVRGRWQYIVAGDPLRQVAEAEQQLRRGEILLSPEARAIIGDTREQPTRAVTLPLPAAPAATPLIEALRAYIPDAASYRLLAGHADWLADLRRMSVIFLSITGISAGDADGVARIHTLMQAFQETVGRYEGSINKLLVDDKGTIAIILFGAPPEAHEDDPLRAVRCALDLQRLAGEQLVELAIGVTAGQVFAGPVGSASRREYTVIGDPVNLAARLMQAAGPGRVLADHATFHATGAEIEWHALPPQIVKGKAAAVRAYTPLRIRPARRAAHTAQLIGRATELARIDAALAELHARRFGLIGIEGDPGIGKSRMVGELVQRARERGIVDLVGSGQSHEQQTPYRGWQPIFNTYFDLDAVALADQGAQVLARLAELAPALLERAPLLNDVLGLGIAENDLTMSLEPQLRQASLTALLIDLLGLWARERPLLLVLEDAQWLDSLSWEVALQAARGLTDRPVLLALALRSPAELPADHPYYRLRRLPQYGAVQLGPLNAGETSALAAARLGVAGMAPALTNLIWQRTSGNPFVVEELVLSLRDSGALQIADGQATLSADPRELRLPDTVQGLVLSRLDRLPAEAQLTLKVASVIGQTFGLPVLRDVYPEQQVREQIPAHLERLGAADMVLTLDEPTTLRSHEFKQAIIHEVTYRTVLHTQRRALHQRVAHWYEQRAAEQGDLVPLLAFHWRQAEDRERELHYATLAARRLAAEYANSEALSYLTRALQLSDDPEEEYALRWSRMQIQERIGNRDGQRDDLAALEALAAAAQHTDHMAQVANAWAALYRDTSDYPAAIAALERALAIARAAGDHTSAARSMTIWGQVMEYQGAYDEARTYIEQALAIYRQIDYRRGVATNLSGLGNICYYQGDYGAARRYDEEALTIRRAIGDRPSEATTLINLGQVSLQIGEVDAARGYIEQALPLAVAIGDRRSEGLALNTLGSIALARAGYVEALQHLERARQIFRVLGDRRLDANCLVSIGLVWRDVGDDARAQGFFEEALAIQHEIGDESLAAYGHLNLAYAQRHSDPQAALEGFAQALALAQHTGNRDAEAFALNYRAMLFEEQAQWEAAAADYHAALPMLVELQAAAAAIECTAGLARAALQEGRIAEARAHIAECIDYLTANGVEGMEFPIQLYLSCYDTLRAAGEDKLAAELLAEARRLLMDRAEQIDNPAMRASFLEHVAAHRRLLAEWEQLRSTR